MMVDQWSLKHFKKQSSSLLLNYWVGPAWAWGHGGTLAPKVGSQSLERTLHESNETSSFEIRYWTECLSCPAPTQCAGPACICNTGKRERNALQNEWVIKLWARFYSFDFRLADGLLLADVFAAMPAWTSNGWRILLSCVKWFQVPWHFSPLIQGFITPH